MLQMHFSNLLLIIVAVLCVHGIHGFIDSSLSRPDRCNATRTPLDLGKIQGIWYSLADSIDDSDPPCPIYNLTLSKDGSEIHVNQTYRYDITGESNGTRSHSYPAVNISKSGFWISGLDREYHTHETDYDTYMIVCGFSPSLANHDPNAIYFKVLSRTRSVKLLTISAMDVFVGKFNIPYRTINWHEQSPTKCYRKNSASAQQGTQLGAILLMVLATGKYLMRSFL